MHKKRVSGVILAAGSGLRLDPISSPKPLVHIGTKPLIIWTIESLQRLGIEDIWLVVGQHGDLIQKEIIGDKRIKSNIRFLRFFESQSMFQSLVYAVSHIPGPLLITPCDLVFEKYPLSPSDLDALTPQSFQVLALPVAPDKETGCHSLIRTSGPGDGLTVKEIGRNIADADFFDIGIYLLGEKAKKALALPLESVSQRSAFYEILGKLFESKKAELKVASAAGNWCDVNTVIDRIRAEMFLKEKAKAPLAAQDPSPQVPADSRSSYHFLYCRKKTTEVIVEPNILSRLWEYEIIPPASAHSTHYLVTDSSLYELVGKKLEEGFNARGHLLKPLIVPLGEKVKTIEEYWRLMTEILANGVDRCSIIMNLGGGTINNVAGFIASTLFRGVSLYHIPTTLLAQLDSTIDIKQAINTPYGKNLVGSFYAADKVIVDPSLLTFLPEEHIINGLSESIKHGLVQDEGLLEFYEKYEGSVRDPNFLEKIVKWTIDLKVKCMVNEPDGDHAEMIKDYGHSIGHALEQYTDYEVHHGRAIAVGMCVSAEIARLLKLTSDRVVGRHYDIFRKYGLTTSIGPETNINDFELVLKHDKTYMQGNAYMGLISDFGRLWHQNGRYAIPVDMEIVKKALALNQKKFSPVPKLPLADPAGA